MDYALTPTSIHRKLPDQAPEIVDIETPEGERALLLFASPEVAESFRENTGRFPDFMGFKVTPIDHEAIRALSNFWAFPQVALYGPEPDTVGFFDTDDFVKMLEDSLQEA